MNGKRVLLPLLALLLSVAPLSARASGLEKNIAWLAKETGTAPKSVPADTLRAYFGAFVPGQTAMVFDLTDGTILVGERTGASSFTVLSVPASGPDVCARLAGEFLARYGTLSGGGRLVAAIRNSRGTMLVRSCEEAAVALSLREALLDAEPPGDEASDPVSYHFYIGNRQSLVFHEPLCPSVQDMKPEHRVPFATREEAEKAGFRPCMRCQP